MKNYNSDVDEMSEDSIEFWEILFRAERLTTAVVYEVFSRKKELHLQH